MSNNIYDILKKMHDLEAPKQTLTESKKAKPDYIDIDKDGDKTEPMKKAAREKSTGAVAEAVATVERQLAEKYQGFKKSVAEGVQAKGSIKSTDSGEEYTAAPGYRVKAEFEPGSTGKPKMGFVKDKSSDSEQTGQAAKPAKPAEKPADQPKVDEDALDFLRDPEGIAKNRAEKAASNQRFADRSAKHFAGQIGDQYHDQLMKTNPAYRDEFLDRVGKIPMNLDTYRKDSRDIQAKLQAKFDPMGGPTNIDYEKIKKNPMATRAGEQGTDWRPWGPGPKNSFDSDEFGRPVREGDMDESALQAYLGKKKYGEQGMQALQKAGRDGASKEKMARIRAQHDKMDEGAMELTPDEIKASEKELYRRNYGDKGYFGSKDPRVAGYQEFINRTSKLTGSPKIKVDGMYGPRTAEATQSTDNFFLHSGRKHPAAEEYWKHHHNITQHAYDDVANGVTRNPLGNVKEEMIDEGEYNEDMLSPKDKEFAALAEPKDKITYADKIAGAKQGKKTEGNRFTAGLANDNVKVGEKIPGTNATKTKDIDEGQDGPEYQKAWAQTRAERKDWEKSNPDKKYYDQGPAERHDMELRKARAADDAAKDAKRSPLGRVANTLSRGLFGQEIDEGRTSMREGWEEMQKYLEKKRGPESKGGAGKKAGTRYGGSAQRDDDEETDGEGQAVVKKKGRPKGTGGGAKFNFKKPKD